MNKLTLSVILLLSSVRLFGNVIFVNQAATGIEDGSSWADAYTKLQDAITASSAGDTIWVATGIYYPDEGTGYTNNDKTVSFKPKNGVVMYGGFNGTETVYSQRDWMTNPCILSGDIDQTPADSLNNSNIVVEFGTGISSSTLLDGFTVQNGFNVSGFRAGGIFCNSSAPRLQNLIVAHNSSAVSNGGGLAIAAGGISLLHSAAKLTNVTVRNNYAVTNCSWTSTSQSSVCFGGVMIYGSSTVQMINARIENNTGVAINSGTGSPGYQGAAATGGIGSYESGCTPTIANSVITGNYAECLLGEYNSAVAGFSADYPTSPKLINVVIYNNSANCSSTGYSYATGGVQNNYASGNILNGATIFNNSATVGGPTAYGGGGYCAFTTGGAYTPTINNTIIYGNTASGTGTLHNDVVISGNSPVFKNCLFQSFTGGTNCVIGNPGFNNAGDPDGTDDTWFTSDDGLHIGCGSPAINSGDSTLLVADAIDIDGDLNTTEKFPYDIRGKKRNAISQLDIGAYEFQSTNQMVVTSCGDYTSPSGNLISLSGIYSDCVVDTSFTIALTVSSINDYSFSATATVLCEGDSTTVSSSTSDLYTDYWLRDDSNNSIVAGPVAGTGSGISFNTGPINTTTTFNVYATKSIGAINLPAGLDLVKFSAPFYAYTNAITVEAWVYFDGTTQPWAGQSTENVDNMTGNVWLWHAGNFYVNDNGSWRSLLFPASVPSGWTHVATVADATGMYIYYNGVLVASGTTSASIISSSIRNNASSVIVLGQDPRFTSDPGRNSNLAFDNFVVWNESRSLADVANDMNTCFTGTEQGLVQYTKFNHDAGVAVYSDKGADGTLINPSSNWIAGSGVCDAECSLQTSDLVTVTINHPTFSTQSVSSCVNYTWNANTYTTSGIYTDTISNMAGCDSIMTLNLTILNATSGTDVQTACDTYTWIDGNTYTSSTSAPTFTLMNAAGCDSVVTLNLTINTVNAGITNSSPTLTALSTGASYQWLNCGTGFSVISGETNQNFTAIANGNYAVAVTQNGCTDTSTCELVNNVGLQEVSERGFSVYPNPATDNVVIRSAETITGIRLLDVNGKVIYARWINASATTLDISTVSAGVYVLEITFEDSQALSKKRIVINK